MKKIITAIILCMPMCAMAMDDLSDCTVIGYADCWECMDPAKAKQSNDEHCAEFGYDDPICRANDKTIDQWAAEMDARAKRVKETDLVFKCPKTPARVAAQSGKPTAHIKYFYNDGTEIDNDVLRADTENVYIFRQAGFFGADNILVSPDEDGLDLVFYQHNK